MFLHLKSRLGGENREYEIRGRINLAVHARKCISSKTHSLRTSVALICVTPGSPEMPTGIGRECPGKGGRGNVRDDSTDPVLSAPACRAQPPSEPVPGARVGRPRGCS